MVISVSIGLEGKRESDPANPGDALTRLRSRFQAVSIVSIWGAGRVGNQLERVSRWAGKKRGDYLLKDGVSIKSNRKLGSSMLPQQSSLSSLTVGLSSNIGSSITLSGASEEASSVIFGRDWVGRPMISIKTRHIRGFG